MRLRLGLLHDADAQQRMHEREQRAAEEKRKKAETPIVRTEEEQKKYDEQQAREEKARAENGDTSGKKEKEKAPKIKIRPLSDARAIELGANFFSESFIFLVAVGLLFAERWYSSNKAGQQRDVVAERLDDLEAQVARLQAEHHLPELEALNEKIKRSREARKQTSWYNPAGWWRRTDPDYEDDDDDEGIPGEVEGVSQKHIPGSVPGRAPEQAIKPKANVEAEKLVPEMQVAEPAKANVTPARVDSVAATKKER